LTRKFVDAIEGTRAKVLDTRRLFRNAHPGKYAVQCGGGTNHRIDLASGILIKNNHISLAADCPRPHTGLERRRHHQRVQVEVRNAQELEAALNTALKPSCWTI